MADEQDPTPPADDAELTPERIAELLRLWRELSQAQGLPDHLSAPETLAAIRKALAGGANPPESKKRRSH